MSGSPPATPKIIVPFLPVSQAAPDRPPQQDIVVYLRPETNGVQTESVLFRVFSNPAWHDHIKLVYLANIPGAFIAERRIIEQHYATRILFARQGAQAFFPEMKQTFERFFGIPFEKADIVGAYEALNRLGMSEEELFHLWVPVYDILEIEGQLIKRTAQNLFIINYDIPALLHKNHIGTDVAAMVFRSPWDYQSFRPVVSEIRQALIQQGLLDPDKPEQRVFHYSKGPFEQLLDAQGYVFNVRDEPHGLEDLSFGQYLLGQGVSRTEISSILTNPLGMFLMADGQIKLKNLYSYTLFDTYEVAWQKFQSRQK